jgi:precorrin-2 dehydrogenase/sirohydrochlorin ferrochelatase
VAEDATRFYPVFLDLTGRQAVIVGGGKSAMRKARQLAGYGAEVTVVSADPGDELMAAEAEGRVMLEHRGYVRGDLAGASVALVVDPDAEVRSAVREEAEMVGCLVNVVDAPELCNFIVPSVVNREPLQIAISTGGLAPMVAKQLRREISERYGPEYGEYARLMGEFRAMVYQKIDSEEGREAVFSAVAESDILERLRSDGAKPTATTLYAQYARFAAPAGDVG